MQAFNGYFQLGNYPCRSAQLVGIIVGVQEQEKRTVYTMDDGTGVIECIRRHNLVSDDGPGMGDTAKCAGRIVETPWNERRLEADSIETLRDPTEEPRHWLQVSELHRTLYHQPFVMPSLPREVSTPKRAKGLCDVPTTDSSVADRSEASSPLKSSLALRHPSKLRSKQLTAETFLVYMKACLMVACEGSAVPESKSFEDPLATPTRAPAYDQDATPKAYVVPSSPSRYVPRYGGRATGKCVARTAMHAEPSGMAVSSLRRVEPLSILARRIVKAEARRRGKQHDAGEKAGSDQLKSSKSKRDNEAQKAKRLFSWALRKLRQEGSIVLGVMPARALVDVDINLSSLWKSQALDGGSILSSATSVDLSHGSNSPPLSPPLINEETYLPVTPSLLSLHVLEAFKHCMRKKGKKKGVSASDILSRMKLDERWEYLGVWHIDETLQCLEGEERVCQMGGEEWALI
ncbi:hypothetical protein CALVIDRAFT_368199 [Calocera viscosa TUFC12733]|uniref:CST complex subunit STN1 n=1 Tax=Calocera viscosa (strain TUFC12733) TaxID=1330018 RepID=A0A167GYU8_CALVF|nr:hypothetical protein CALVIDRAFT_368199 [Calocera viscosa TUFC12733]